MYVIFSQLKTHSKKTIVRFIYKPLAHNDNYDRKLYHQIIEVSNTFESVIVGLLNLSFTSWGNFLKFHLGHDLNNNLLANGLSIKVIKPREVTIYVPDLIFSTNGGLVSNSGPELSTSEQKIVSFNINLEIHKEKVSEKLIFTYLIGSFEKFRKIFADTDWVVVGNETDVSISWK